MVENDNTLYAQVRQDSSEFVFMESFPTFLAGEKAMNKIIRDNLIYPDSSRRENIEGTVTCEFVVDTNGNVTLPKVVKGINDEMNNEAIRLIKLLNGWSPGIANGKKERVMIRQTIDFTITRKKRLKRENN